METHLALAWALSGTSAMFICVLPPPAFTIPVPYSARFARYMYVRLIEYMNILYVDWCVE